MSKPLPKLLSTALEANGYQLSAEIQEQLVHFLEMMQKWNQVFNLTAIVEPQEMVILHILDSLSLLPHLNGQRILDVGSGGGLPGIPLAIVDPSKTWVLMDKSQKKTRFLIQAIAELGLKNVSVVCSRCEDFKSPEGFDSIVSRAFGTIALMITGTQQLLRPEGRFLAMKGNYPEEEMAELPAGFKVAEIQELKIKGLEAKRHLVSIEKG